MSSIIDSVKAVGKKVSALAVGGMFVAGALGALNQVEEVSSDFVDTIEASVGSVTSGVQTSVPADAVTEADTADDSLSQMVEQMAQDVSEDEDPEYQRLGC